MRILPSVLPLEQNGNIAPLKAQGGVGYPEKNDVKKREDVLRISLSVSTASVACAVARLTADLLVLTN
jgi:hypothetical protein